MGKLFGKKAWAIGAIWVENTVIYSVLGQGCLEGRLGPFMLHGSKTLLFSVFWNNLFGKEAWAGAAIWAENTVIFSVWGQVV